MGLYRVSPQSSQPTPKDEGGAPVPLEVWLDNCQNEYDVLVARLRHLDEVLVKYKRKRSYLLPKRMK